MKSSFSKGEQNIVVQITKAVEVFAVFVLLMVLVVVKVVKLVEVPKVAHFLIEINPGKRLP
jgi:hypothetical protein